MATAPFTLEEIWETKMTLVAVPVVGKPGEYDARPAIGPSETFLRRFVEYGHAIDVRFETPPMPEHHWIRKAFLNE